MTDHDAEMDGILKLLRGAGLVEVYVDVDGKHSTRLTDDGERLARQMAMSEDPDAVLEVRSGGALRDGRRGPPHAGRAPSVRELS